MKTLPIYALKRWWMAFVQNHNVSSAGLPWVVYCKPQQHVGRGSRRQSMGRSLVMFIANFRNRHHVFTTIRGALLFHAAGTAAIVAQRKPQLYALKFAHAVMPLHCNACGGGQIAERNTEQ